MFTNRQVGVQVPTNQGRERDQGPAATVTYVLPCQFFAVKVYDEEGMERSMLVMQAGGKLYYPPNSEEWSLGLTGLKPWMENGVKAKLASPGPAPKEDTVDVLPDLK